MTPSPLARRELRDFNERQRRRRLMTQNAWVRFWRWLWA
jgi:hypothetical protein